MENEIVNVARFIAQSSGKGSLEWVGCVDLNKIKLF